MRFFYNLLVDGIFQSIHNRKDSCSPISYALQGRSGTIFFKDGNYSFTLFFELNGGDTIATIWLPSDENWVRETGAPLEQKAHLLNLIGQQIAADQVSGGKGRYRIEKQFIHILNG